MAESAVLNGQYRALEARVEDLRGNYHEMRRDFDGRFSALHDDIAKMASDMNTRFDRLVENGSGKNGGDVTRYGTILGIGAAIMTSVIGGFVTLENNSINASIAALSATVDKNNSRVEANLKEAVSHAESRIDTLVATTVPRPELDDRINANREGIRSLNGTSDALTKQLASLTAEMNNVEKDNERTKDNIVSRAENQTHWNDYEHRLEAINVRLAELQKESGGGSMIEQLRQLREQVNDFQRKFIAIPAYPKLTPYGTDDGGRLKQP